MSGLGPADVRSDSAPMTFLIGYMQGGEFYRTREDAIDSRLACLQVCERRGINMDAITSIREL